MKKNIRIKQIVRLLLFQMFFMNFVLFLVPPAPTFAQAPSQLYTRFTVPVGSNANLVVEKANGSESQTALISDSLASTKVILSSDGNMNVTPQYYPYGTSLSQLTQNSNNRYYTGQRKVDNDDSLYNYNARYYSPESGVFTQPDSIQGPNRFAYVGGNPVTRNDPRGHNMCEEDPWLSPVWSVLQQCNDSETGDSNTEEDWTQEKGLSGVANLTQTVDDFSGNVGSVVSSIGDKLGRSGKGSKVNKGAVIAGVAGIVVGPIMGRLGSSAKVAEELVATPKSVVRAPYRSQMYLANIPEEQFRHGGTSNAWDDLIYLFKGLASGYDGGDIVPGGIYQGPPTHYGAGTLRMNDWRIMTPNDSIMIHDSYAHAFLGHSANSPFSSWTPDYSLASSYAGENGSIIGSWFRRGEVIDIGNDIRVMGDFARNIMAETLSRARLPNTSDYWVNFNRLHEDPNEFLKQGIVAADRIHQFK